MKKIFAALLLLSTILSCFCSCNTPPDQNQDQDVTPPENSYKVTVTGLTDMLIEPLESYYEAGTKVIVRTSVITEVGIHVFVNGKKTDSSYQDHEWKHTFIMPTNDVNIYITTNEYYNRDDVAFSELVYQIDHFKNITKVYTKNFTYTTPYGLIETRYSYKQEEIDNLKAISAQKLTPTHIEPGSPNTKNSTYFFGSKTTSENYSFEFVDNLLCMRYFANTRYFKFTDSEYTLPTIENPDLITYSFRYTGDPYIKKYGDEEVSIKYQSTFFTQVEFIPYEGEEINIEPAYYIEDKQYGKIHLLTATVFEWNGEYYEIISGAEHWAYKYAK